MRRKVLTTVLVWLAAAQAGAEVTFDSALAPYPWRREAFGPEVEALLAKIETNAPAGGALSASVAWQSEPAVEHKRGRDEYGPLSEKSCPNWHRPAGGGSWVSGTFDLYTQGGDFLIVKPEDEAAPRDWWQKAGEDIVSRAYSVDWPTILLFHTDALEADMLGYGEGLGLLLWAAQPGEYLRRTDNLAIVDDVRIDGRVYRRLVATPEWIARKLLLRNKRHYPFNQSTLTSWATKRPQIVYYIDEERGLVAGADFVFCRVLRSGPEDWEAGSGLSGLVVSCFAEELGRSPGGAWYPARIRGEVRRDEELLRATTWEVTLGAAAEALPALELPAGKRRKHAWPPYRAGDCERFIEAGDTSHATRFGLAAALAFEGDPAAALAAAIDAVGALEEDTTMLPETYGGVDWEMGFAVYELFCLHEDAHLAAVWEALPRTPTWSLILAKAVHLYRTYRPDDAGRIVALRAAYDETFEGRRFQELERQALEIHRGFLQREAARERQNGDLERAAHLESHLSRVDAALAK